jgi:precorrin-6B methylase 2
LIRLVTERAGAGSRVLETGAGNSTIAFLLAGAHAVTAIAPDAGLFERIRSYCAAHHIDAARLHECASYSEDALPGLVAEMEMRGEHVDVALIDGGHGWPTVFVDFCYMYRSLRKGGFLVVDDIQLYSVGELSRFLSEDPHVRLVECMPKTLVFEKTVEKRYLPDFGAQPYIRRKMQEEQHAARTVRA